MVPGSAGACPLHVWRVPRCHFPYPITTNLPDRPHMGVCMGVCMGVRMGVWHGCGMGVCMGVCSWVCSWVCVWMYAWVHVAIGLSPHGVRPSLHPEPCVPQILPPISRLCEPIQETSQARIAECLGLDPSRFRHTIKQSDGERPNVVGCGGVRWLVTKDSPPMPGH